MTIGTFSSKLLVFLLLPLYTRVLTDTQYGTVDLVAQVANLLIPMVSIGITSGIIRFGLDKAYNKQDVFTIGLRCVLLGFLVMVLLYPLLNLLSGLTEARDYTLMLYPYTLMACLKSLCAQFVRSREMVRLYAVNGVLDTIMTILFNVLFLVVFQWGVEGYLLAIIMADFTSVLFLFFTAKLYRFVHRPVDKTVQRAMLRYSVPMIPNTVFWWVTNVSDRLLVAGIAGVAANGLYAISYKLPSIVTLLSTIFMEAWQVSAMREKDSKTRSHFFTNVFASFSAIVFVSASFIIAFCQVIIRLLTTETFFGAWEFVPVLVVATVFSCFVSFLGSVYMLEKNSGRALSTTVLGAGLNIVLNLLLIPGMGPQGAAIATAASYLLVFLVRLLDTNRRIRTRLDPARFYPSLLLLGGQTIVMLAQPSGWELYQALFILGMCFFNCKPLLTAARRILGKRGRRSRA